MSSALDARFEDDADTDDEEAVTIDLKPEQFTWTIENFSELQARTQTGNGKHFSEEWVCGGCKWRLLIFPNGNPSAAGAAGKHLSLYLDVPDREGLAVGWRRQARFWLNVVDQKDPTKTHKQETNVTLSAQTPDFGFPQLMSFTQLKDPANGYCVDDRIIVQADLVVQKVWTENFTMGHYSLNTRKELGYVGLRNQGATCYLNSLIQGLFHIGAFRRSVYMMSTDKDDVSKSIPLALQRLFYRMQFLDEAPATKELTRSFGWSDYEGFKQHDVQELNRVLMDKLENKMKGTLVQDTEGYIENLFKGKKENFIKCTSVPYKSTREEDFYDLSLVVKGLKDIYESFDQYLQVELMDGDNKYSTDDYGYQPAHRGERFLTLPPVLNIQLKRWEMDYVRMAAYKVNDLYMFYPILDLSKYLDRTINKDSGIYHLHAVLVHSGGAGGGHYYVYVRPSTKPRWYKFNDSMVSVATEKEAVDDNWGGEEVTRYYRHGKHYNFSYARSANAYMLIYVRETEMHKYMNDDCLDVIPSHLAAANEEHLIVDLKICTEENLRKHDQTLFDLCSLSEVTPQRFKKNMPISAFKAQAAQAFGIPVERQRYWVFEFRNRTKTIRIVRSLSAAELDQPIQHLRPLLNFAQDAYPMLLLLPDDPDPSSGEPRPISAIDEDYLLFFFKFYDPVTSTVSYVGHAAFSLASSNHAELESKFRQLAGDLVPAGRALKAWKEERPEKISEVDPAATCAEAGDRLGDIFVFALEPEADAPPTPHPTPASWYPYIRERMVVEFRSYVAPDDESPTAKFSLECQKGWSYEQVQQAVAAKIAAEPLNIRFWGYQASSHSKPGPKSTPCDRRGGVTLQHFIKWFNDSSPDILYYEVLSVRVDQIEMMKKIKIDFQMANLKSLPIIPLLVPKTARVSEIFPILLAVPEVAAVINSDPAEGKTFGTKEFRLLEIWNGKIIRTFKAGDSVMTSFYENQTYVVQEMAKEELAPNYNGQIHKFCTIQHFAVTPHGAPAFHGKPFHMVLNRKDTVAETRKRIQNRLQMTDEEFDWKLKMIVSFHRIQVLDDATLVEALPLEGEFNMLALEHPDDKPAPTYPTSTGGTGSMFRDFHRETGITITDQ